MHVGAEIRNARRLWRPTKNLLWFLRTRFITVAVVESFDIADLIGEHADALHDVVNRETELVQLTLHLSLVLLHPLRQAPPIPLLRLIDHFSFLLVCLKLCLKLLEGCLKRCYLREDE